MKGTYDNGAGFVVEFIDGQKRKNNVSLTYDELDGMLVQNTLDNFKVREYLLHAVHVSLIEAQALGYIQGNFVTVLKGVERPEEEVAFEYHIGKNIADNYKAMNDIQKKFALAFLERYLFSYEEVKKFQLVGYLDFCGCGIDKKFGGSGKSK
jgi:hypothetical protein